MDRAQKKAHRAMVAKCGYNWNSSLAMLFGPTWLSGATFFHLCNFQGFDQISYFLKHWRSPKASPDKMLWIAVSWLQFCAGISTSQVEDKFYFAERIERDKIGCRNGQQVNQFKPNEKAWKV